MTDHSSLIQKVEGLVSFDVRVLASLNSGNPIEWGAAVGESLEFLKGRGLVTSTMPYSITPEGRAALTYIVTKAHEAEND